MSVDLSGSKAEQLKRTSFTSKRHGFFHFTGHHNDPSEDSKHLKPAANKEASKLKKDTLAVEVPSLHYRPTPSHSPASSVEDVKLTGLAAEAKAEKITVESDVGDTGPVFPVPVCVSFPCLTRDVVAHEQ